MSRVELLIRSQRWLAAGDVRIRTRLPHPQIESLNRIVEKIKAAGGKSIAVQGSVTSSREIDCFFLSNQTEKQLGKAAIRVDNAVVFAYGGGRKLGSFMGDRSRTTKNFAVSANGRREGSGFARNSAFQPATGGELT